MGLRNPFRFAVDRRTGTVYLGDYSPDANEPDPARGPAGHGRWMTIERRPARPRSCWSRTRQPEVSLPLWTTVGALSTGAAT
jgi:hypothetical protein